MAWRPPPVPARTPRGAPGTTGASLARAPSVAALCHTKSRQLPGDRLVTHPHRGTLLDAHLAATAVEGSRRPAEQLDLQVELLAGPLHVGHDKAIQPDEAGGVVLHLLSP